MNIQVIKRDGSREKFSIINIAKVVTTAGLTPEQAKTLAQHIESWALATGKDEVTSLEIRDQVLMELKKVNANAADLYTWYQQSKEV